MKNLILSISFALFATMGFAKDLQTLVATTQPQMHCQGCENKIKGNLRFEKGVKSIETSVADQTVTIVFDADKNTEEALLKSFEKFGYKATKVAPGEKVQQQNTSAQCDNMKK